MNKIRGTLATFIAFALILALAAPAMATILYDENGKTGTVYCGHYGKTKNPAKSTAGSCFPWCLEAESNHRHADFQSVFQVPLSPECA